MHFVFDLFYIQFLGNTFRFYTIQAYWTRNGILILLPEHKAFISPEWVCGQGIKDPFCSASWEKRLLQPQDVVLSWRDHLTTVGCPGYRFSLKFPASPIMWISMIYRPGGIPVVVLVLDAIYLPHCWDFPGVCMLVNVPRSPCLQLGTYLWCCEIQHQLRRTRIQASHKLKPRLMFVCPWPLWPLIWQL